MPAASPKLMTTSPTTPEEWRERIGVPITKRREELGYRSVRAAAKAVRRPPGQVEFNEATWRQVESGKRQVARGIDVVASPSPATVVAMAKVLDWPDDFIEILIRGDHPPPRSSAQSLQQTSRARIGNPSPEAQMEQLRAGLASLTEAVYRLAEREGVSPTDVGLPPRPPDGEKSPPGRQKERRRPPAVG